MEDCLAAMMSDDNAAIGAVIHDRGPLSSLYDEYFDYMRIGHGASGKPVFLVSNRQGTGTDARAVAITREGFPVLDGLRPFLAGARCLFDYRDFRSRHITARPAPDADVASRWRSRLATGDTLEEYESTRLLNDFGFPVNPAELVDSEEALLDAAERFGYPLVLKTAEPGILHKTDCGGVVLNIETGEQLLNAYDDLTVRLGPQVMLCPMLQVSGVEMVLGLVRDEQFGPLVMLGFGGVNVETIRDVAYALPPFDRSEAMRLLDGLQLRSLLDGLRDRPPVDISAFCAAAERFSLMAAVLGNTVNEIDVNPVIVHPDGCIAVDALVIGHATGS